MLNAGIRFDEIERLVERLEKSAADMPRIAKDAIDAAAPIVREEFSRQVPRSNPLRGATPRNSWRNGMHAADDVHESGFKMRRDKQGVYKVVGYDKGDTGKHFYVKFFQTGRKVFNPANYRYAVRHGITGNRNPDKGHAPRKGEPPYFAESFFSPREQEPRPIVEKVMANAAEEAMAAMKAVLAKEII